MKILQKIKDKSQNPAGMAPVKIAFLGDSVTHGCFEIIDKGDGRIDCIYDHDAVYHHQLKRKIEQIFPNCPVSVINAGISGGNAVQGAERVQRDIVDAQPDLAVVCFGLNDAGAGADGLSAYRDALQSIFQQLHHADIDVVFMTPNMMCTYPCPQLTTEWLRQTSQICAAVQLDGRMDSYMQSAREICQQENVLLCDCYVDWKRLQELGADITYLLSNYINHPTREMHGLFAERLFSSIFFSKI
jgi:acyl-CoA thioesterase-1